MARVRRYARRLHQPEAELQRACAELFDGLGLLWCHIPNGGARSARTGAWLKSLGVKAGAPDALIFERLPSFPNARGLAVEFKTDKGRLTESQSQWHTELERCVWEVRVVRSVDGMVDVLAEVGIVGL